MPGESWNDYCDRLDRYESQEDFGDRADRAYECMK